MAAFTCLATLGALLVVGVFALVLDTMFPSSSGAPGNQNVNWLIAGGGFAFLVLSTVANFVAARSLAVRRRRTFCLLVAGLNCLQVPLGSLLGLFGLATLLRRDVRAL